MKRFDNRTVARAIVQRTRGRTHGPATRLMSPSDFGEILKPFVFLDLFDHEGAPFSAGLHPHSGIATLTYVPHKHDLVLGSHSVHTTPAALRDAQAHISAIRTRLAQEGRL